MKLKKVISVMLVGACVFSMAACGSKKEEANDSDADYAAQLENEIQNEINKLENEKPDESDETAYKEWQDKMNTLKEQLNHV